jgi:SAM-dependent methyltransferase
MKTTEPVSQQTESWEAAYVRFETPQEEIKKFIRRLRKLGADEWPKDVAILELFCGRGNGLVALERLGFTRVLGVDLSPRLIAMHNGRARCCVADCRVLPVRTDSQDVVIVQGGLHHLQELPEDLRRVVDEVRRALAPGGLFIVVEPWLTPFLHVVHRVTYSRLARRRWSKLDALATMIDHERETYERWLRQPELVSTLLCDRFEPRIKQKRWGKLLFAGRKR